MNAHERSEKLFIESEKIGLDAPTEGMVSDAIHNAECDIVTECVCALKQYGMTDAAGVIERAMDRKSLEMREG